MKISQIIAFLAASLVACAGNLFAENDSSTSGINKYNFNSDWRLFVGESSDDLTQPGFDDKSWKKVTLPRPWNEDEAFAKDIHALSESITWYRKHFTLPKDAQDKKVFIEFEGVRQAGDVFVNGQAAGFSENGVMAFGMDITPFLKPAGEENVIAVKVNSSWSYRERATNTPYQWSDKNFNSNYGGINKNVYLHVKSPLYQTFPLYSNLGTTGVYIYAKEFDIAGKKARIHAESQVKNENKTPQTFEYEVIIEELDGKVVKQFKGASTTIQPGETSVVKTDSIVDNLNFWSWGYGYLYNVKTNLLVNGQVIDTVTTRTGFRKTDFKNGYLTLNDRPIQLKGYAQRTTNEWPALGASIPAWLSDYSNDLMVKSNANLVRWMHVTPWKQDIESCDRVGLIQAMPAGDSERDPTGRRWEMRVEVMRDAIIYNRNNPSIIFYECGNNQISEEHMKQMKDVRDQYDPNGGRAIGSRNMLDSKIAEYGGEMLYINKSAAKPMWQMEYSRDEGARRYWDDYSPPYHKDWPAYNRNQDSHAIENIVRWYEYYRQRPGTGSRVNGGGVNIIFSDTNTHFRNAEVKYRLSGEVDAMRIPKDGFYAHQIMWNGWVDVEKPGIHIMGHWNYIPSVKKSINVISSADHVKLSLNGKDLGTAVQSNQFLFTFANVQYEPGTLIATGFDKDNKEICRYQLRTVGEPAAIKLTPTVSPVGFVATGSDVALVDVEVVDASGNRCPIATNTINFSLDGPAEYRGGIAMGREDNYILSQSLPVECGINRVILRSTTKDGKITLTAKSEGLKDAVLTLETKPFTATNGLTTKFVSDGLQPRLDRGPTPLTPSFRPSLQTLAIKNITANTNVDAAASTVDDNETSSWSGSWINYELESPATISHFTMMMRDKRNRSYPIRILIDGKEVYTGTTPRSLGYIDIPIKPTQGKNVRIQLTGTSDARDDFNNIVEVTGNKLNEAGADEAAGNADKATTKPTTPPATQQRDRGPTLGIVEMEIKSAVK